MKIKNEKVIETIYQGDVKKLKKFLQQGLDINQPLDEGDRTCLHYAVTVLCYEPLKALLDLFLSHPEINIEAQDFLGITPLLRAGLKNNLAAIKRLIEKGADYTLKDKEGASLFYLIPDMHIYLETKQIIQYYEQSLREKQAQAAVQPEITPSDKADIPLSNNSQSSKRFHFFSFKELFNKSKRENTQKEASRLSYVPLK